MRRAYTLKTLDLPTLVHRRLRGEIEAYKLVNERYDVKSAPVLEFEDRLGPVTGGHCYKFTKTRSISRIRQNIFVKSCYQLE